MASINDVFDALNDIKGRLDTLHSDETNVEAKLDTANARLDSIDTTLADVGSRLESRLVEIRSGQQTTNDILVHESTQLAAILCALDQIARGVCTLVNLGTAEVRLLSATAENTRVIADIDRTSHPDAALDLSRRDAAAAALAACCPPTPEEPACRHEPCDDPGPYRKPTVVVEVRPHASRERLRTRQRRG